MSIDIDAIEARENAATPGPWYSDNSDNMDDAGNHYSVMYGDGWYLARVWKDMKQSNCVADAAFIAAARQDVPALCAEVRELRAALERERMELVSASVSVSRARELTLAQEIRANNLSAALERARALLAEQAEIITANVWHIPPEYSARNIVMDAAAKMRELAALLAAASGGAA